MGAMSTIAMGALAAGAALSAAGAIQSGQMAAKQASMQADLINQQAEREKQIGEINSEEFRRDMSRKQASRRALLGGSGTDPGSGSNLMVTTDMAGEIELQALRLRNSGELAAHMARSQASLTRWGGQAEKRASYTRAGASLLSGIGQSYALGSRLPGKTAGGSQYDWYDRRDG